MNKRLITKREEQIFKLVHHDFDGLSQIEAAQQLGISRSTVSHALARVKKVLLQYFPILTKLEAKCYHYYMIEGWSVFDIAKYIDKSQNMIYEALHRAKNKGMYFTEAKGRVLSYDESMDAHVKQKF